MSSPGGDLNQAVIMGEIIRSHGLATAVGVVDASGPGQALLLRQRLRVSSTPAATAVTGVERLDCWGVPIGL